MAARSSNQLLAGFQAFLDNILGPDKPRRPDRCLTGVWSISSPCLLYEALHGAYCLNCDFIWLAKFPLEKQANYLWSVMALCVGIECMSVSIS